MAWWLSWLERRPVTAEVVGSNPIRVACFKQNYIWGLSSAGRASALQAEGHRFEPCRPHQFCRLGSMAEQLTCNQQVVGSTPITSSIIWPLGQAVKTPPFHGGNRGSIPLGVTILIRKHSSAGRASALQAEGHRFDPCCFHHNAAQ